MSKFIEELKRRNVIKSTIAYLVVIWILLQLLSILLPIIEAPDWVIKTLTLLMAIGFPIWVIFSWVYEVTPKGIKKTINVPIDQSITAKTNKRLNILIIFFLIIAIVVSFFNRSAPKIISSKISKPISENSIAVLPFKDMSSENDTKWFCDGVAEDILTNLTKIKGLKVISRTSTERYRDTDKSIPEIAKGLGVSYILDGSVRKHDDKVLISAQLISANDEQIWADKYNENLEDVFKIQQDVSKKIANQLHIVISPEEEKLLNTAPTDNLKAYELLLRARSFAENGTKEDFDLSIDLYQQAIDLDPNFADAYTEMALSYIYNRTLDMNSWNQNLIKVKQLIDKSLLIDPNSAKAYSAKGMLNKRMLNIYDNKSEESKENFEKALELNSNDAVAHRNIAVYFYHGRSGDLNKSLYHINRAAELDPFSPLTNKLKIDILLFNGKIVEAEEFYNNKNSLFSDQIKINIQNDLIKNKAKKISFEKKDWSEAIKYFHEAIKEDPQNAYIYRTLGDAYDVILNDDINFIKYTKKAYKLDSTDYINVISYLSALLEGKKFKEAEKLMNNDNYKNSMSDQLELIGLFYYYYYFKDYNAALEILNDSLMKDQYNFKSLVLAQKGDVKGVREILNKHTLNFFEKALIFAILNERDSMYYYLDKEKNIILINLFNSRKEVDPYRKEEKYKEYLKNNYLPVTHWNE